MKKYADADGILHFDIPMGITDKEVETMVIYQSIETQTKPKTPEEMGWSPRFFEQTNGSCQDDPIVIDSEGDFEEREPLFE